MKSTHPTFPLEGARRPGGVGFARIGAETGGRTVRSDEAVTRAGGCMSVTIFGKEQFTSRR